MSSIDKFVPVLDGSNWLSWSENMTSYLKSQGLWQIVAGNVTWPADPPTGSTLTAVQIQQRLTYTDLDDRAMGLIQLRLTPSIHQTLTRPDRSEQVWDNLEETYGKRSAPQIFSMFKQAIEFKISPQSDPSPQILRLDTLFERLTTEQVELPAFVQAMTLLNAITQSWDNIASTLLQTHDTDTLTFKIIRDQVNSEWHRRHAGPSNNATKTSAVKRTGDDTH